MFFQLNYLRKCTLSPNNNLLLFVSKNSFNYFYSIAPYPFLYTCANYNLFSPKSVILTIKILPIVRAPVFRVFILTVLLLHYITRFIRPTIKSSGSHFKTDF